MIVVDASVIVDLVLRDRLPRDVWETLASEDVDLNAPHLLDAEVVSALRRALLSGHTSEDRLRLALRRLRSARIERWPLEPMVEHMWTWRHRLSAYDAAYVVLAERLQCPLFTRDRRLARAPGLRIPVTVV